MKNVAIIMLGISEWFGGAERQFADTYDSFQKKKDKKINLFFIVDDLSMSHLNDVGKLKYKNNLIILPNFSKFSNKTKITLWTLLVLINIHRKRIDLLHIGLPSISYLPLLYLINLTPKFIFDTKLVFNATGARVSHIYKNLPSRDAYKMYIDNIKFDGVFSWYEHFKKVFKNNKNFIKNNTQIVTAKYCFANMEKFKPLPKENNIVWAARLTDSKKPLMFIEAVYVFKSMYLNEVTRKWNFFMYGKGELEGEVSLKIEEYGLQDMISLRFTNMMNEVFGKSKCFVSTQELENFTSLSMLEAMASGNAILSRNVGQTEHFVKNGINGFLLHEDTAHNLAYYLNEFIMNYSEYRNMHVESENIAKNIHNVDNFLNDIQSFWVSILRRYDK